MRLFKDDFAELPLFSGANRSELALIRRHLTKLPVAAGRVLVHEGARGDEFMIIAEGEATVTQGGHVIATLGHGTSWARWPCSRRRLRSSQRNGDRDDRRHGLRRVAERVPPNPRSGALGGPQGTPNGGRSRAAAKSSAPPESHAGAPRGQKPSGLQRSRIAAVAGFSPQRTQTCERRPPVRRIDPW